MGTCNQRRQGARPLNFIIRIQNFADLPLYLEDFEKQECRFLGSCADVAVPAYVAAVRSAVPPGTAVFPDGSTMIATGTQAELALSPFVRPYRPCIDHAGIALVGAARAVSCARLFSLEFAARVERTLSQEAEREFHSVPQLWLPPEDDAILRARRYWRELTVARSRREDLNAPHELVPQLTWIYVNVLLMKVEAATDPRAFLRDCRSLLFPAERERFAAGCRELGPGCENDPFEMADLLSGLLPGGILVTAELSASLQAIVSCPDAACRRELLDLWQDRLSSWFSEPDAPACLDGRDWRHALQQPTRRHSFPDLGRAE